MLANPDSKHERVPENLLGSPVATRPTRREIRERERLLNEQQPSVFEKSVAQKSVAMQPAVEQLVAKEPAVEHPLIEQSETRQLPRPQSSKTHEQQGSFEQTSPASVQSAAATQSAEATQSAAAGRSLPHLSSPEIVPMVRDSAKHSSVQPTITQPTITKHSSAAHAGAERDNFFSTLVTQETQSAHQESTQFNHSHFDAPDAPDVPDARHSKTAVEQLSPSRDLSPDTSRDTEITRGVKNRGFALSLTAMAPSSARKVTSMTAQNRATAQTRALSARGTKQSFQKTMSVLAISFATLFVVASSIPASALLTPEDVQAQALESLKTDRTLSASQKVKSIPGQAQITVERDGYKSETISEFAAASGIRLESSFTNNPTGTIQWPFTVGVHVGDRFGYRSCRGCSQNHGGQDFNPGDGAPIQAIADGVVSLAEDGEGTLGVNMIIDHQINGKTVSSVYAHMQHGSMRFRVGDHVKVASLIGKTGNTGMSTGPHLHFEIRLGGKDGTKIDPLVWLKENTN